MGSEFYGAQKTMVPSFDSMYKVSVKWQCKVIRKTT